MNAAETRLAEQLATLKLVAVAEQYAALASEAAQKQWPHVDYLARLVDSEAQRRQELTIQRRIAAARFPCIKTLDQFDWNWPKKINRTQVQNLFRLAFLPDKGNVVFMGGVGLGKSHLCQKRLSQGRFSWWPCELNRVNPFDYLMALQHHAAAVPKAPQSWLPWNYEQAIAAVGCG